jgi:hypothetical protein
MQIDFQCILLLILRSQIFVLFNFKRQHSNPSKDNTTGLSDQKVLQFWKTSQEN